MKKIVIAAVAAATLVSVASAQNLQDKMAGWRAGAMVKVNLGTSKNNIHNSVDFDKYVAALGTTIPLHDEEDARANDLTGFAEYLTIAYGQKMDDDKVIEYRGAIARPTKETHLDVNVGVRGYVITEDAISKINEYTHLNIDTTITPFVGAYGIYKTGGERTLHGHGTATDVNGNVVGDEDGWAKTNLDKEYGMGGEIGVRGYDAFGIENLSWNISLNVEATKVKLTTRTHSTPEVADKMDYDHSSTQANLAIGFDYKF